MANNLFVLPFRQMVFIPSFEKVIPHLLSSLMILASCSGNEPPPPTTELELDIQDCLVETSGSKLEVLTWNVEQFPLSGSKTISELAKMIEDLDADIIALQEIKTAASFNSLLEILPGWAGEISLTGNLNLAFLYKQSEISINIPIYTIYNEDSYAFPRPPAIIELTHSSGQVTIINIHLKCCDGQENFERRKEASEKLKSYIDDNLDDKAVILLGDYNDLISGKDPTNIPFTNFINDSLNYVFADMSIAEASASLWSYPSWPSHIDHILISDELFSAIDITQTLRFDQCDQRYASIVSDHRPIILKLH